MLRVYIIPSGNGYYVYCGDMVCGYHPTFSGAIAHAEAIGLPLAAIIREVC